VNAWNPPILRPGVIVSEGLELEVAGTAVLGCGCSIDFWKG